MPPVIATLATNRAIPDLRVFLQTLQLWNTGAEPTVFIFADKDTVDILPSIPYKGRIIYKECLSGYTALHRSQMERLPGMYGSLWAQFMAEKINLLEWAIETAKPQDGVFFFDSDITFFGPLPTIPPDATVVLSPHLIREGDEARFGRYNGGFLWVKNAEPLAAWRAACATSRFYEQAALECFNAPVAFGAQHNYGWWRLWQGRRPAPELAAAWSMRRDPAHSGILVEGTPLGSVHTHWGPGQPPDAEAFNSFVKEWLVKLAPSHGPAKKLLAILSAAKK